MRIEINEDEFDLWRVFGAPLSEAVAGFFKDHGFQGAVKTISLYRGWVEIEVYGSLPAIFSTDGQAHGTVFYRKVENPQDYSTYRQ